MLRTTQRRGASQQPRGTVRGQVTPFALSALAAAALTLLPVTDSAWAAEAEIATDRRKSDPKDPVALPAITVTADKTDDGIGSVGFDDDGVKSMKWPRRRSARILRRS